MSSSVSLFQTIAGCPVVIAVVVLSMFSMLRISEVKIHPLCNAAVNVAETLTRRCCMKINLGVRSVG